MSKPAELGPTSPPAQRGKGTMADIYGWMVDHLREGHDVLPNANGSAKRWSYADLKAAHDFLHSLSSSVSIEEEQ